MSEIKLPEPKNGRSYSDNEIIEIIKFWNVSIEEFNKYLGVITCEYDSETETTYIYPCDVENTLNRIINGSYKFFD